MESAPGAGSTYGSCTEEGESCRRVAMVDDGERARKSDACNFEMPLMYNVIRGLYILGLTGKKRDYAPLVDLP
jgi:hypothetical protein